MSIDDGHREAFGARYYENEEIWSRDFELDPEERQRLDVVLGLIPEGVRSVLDVGCGNGAFLNRLMGTYARVCGVDRSEAALRFVRSEHYRAGAERLPFVDGEFDLVTCMEVIEHSPEGTYDEALQELARVAGRWLIVTVPFREDRGLDLIRCPRCMCEFNRSYHLRSFNEERMRGLFEAVRTSKVMLKKLTVAGVRLIRPGLSVARRIFAPFRLGALPAGAVCPHCRYSNERAGAGADGSTVDVGATWRRLGAFWPKSRSPRWYVALYEKA